MVLMDPSELQHLFDVRWNPRNGRLGKDGAGDCSDVPRGGRGFSPGAVYTQVRAMHQMLGAHFVYAVPSHASDKFLINSMMTLLADSSPRRAMCLLVGRLMVMPHDPYLI